MKQRATKALAPSALRVTCLGILISFGVIYLRFYCDRWITPGKDEVSQNGAILIAAIESYSNRFASPPKSLDQLVEAGSIKAIPRVGKMYGSAYWQYATSDDLVSASTTSNGNVTSNTYELWFKPDANDYRGVFYDSASSRWWVNQ